VAVYRQDWALANTALSESFFNISGDLNTGSWHLFSTAGGDQLNPQYFPLNANGEARVVEPSFITDAETGDRRVTAKTNKRLPLFRMAYKVIMISGSTRQMWRRSPLSGMKSLF